ncbi:MAG: hypothetical protein Q9197_003588 [Variospora fuerteventurae]
MASSVRLHDGTSPCLDASIRFGPHTVRVLRKIRLMSQKQGAIYISYGIINILTDLVIVLIPLALLWKVQIGQSRKRAIYAVFVIRLLVCIATALELTSLTEYLRNADKPWFIVDSTIWGQASMNLSIITACIPSMKPLFDMLQFSLIDSSVAPPGPTKVSTRLVGPLTDIELKPMAHTSRRLRS